MAKGRWVPWVERAWQVNMRLGQPRNRVAEARTFFFRLADAGLAAPNRSFVLDPFDCIVVLHGMEIGQRTGGNWL